MPRVSAASFVNVRTGKVVARGDYKTGNIGWRYDDLQRHNAYRGLETIIGLTDHNEYGAGSMSDLVERLHETSEEIDAAEKRFFESRDRFRSNIKNEIASIEASAKKVSTEMLRIRQAIGEVSSACTSADFVSAIENAERLAAALTAINGLTSSKLTFAVIGK